MLVFALKDSLKLVLILSFGALLMWGCDSENPDPGQTDDTTKQDSASTDDGVDDGQGTDDGSNADTSGTVLYSWDFNSNVGPDEVLYGTNDGGQIDFSQGFFRASYPATGSGESYVYFSVKQIASENLSDVCLEFDARMPDAKHGLKFVKIFGKKDKTGYANVTFGCEYVGGDISQIAFGDGLDTDNDTRHVIQLDGSNGDLAGRNFPNAEVETPQNRDFEWTGDWHHFRMRFKYNSGTSESTEVADGIIYLEIDGKVYCDARGLFNRHYSNSLYIDKVGLAGWAQSSPEPFMIDYDNVVISTGGFVGSGN